MAPPASRVPEFLSRLAESRCCAAITSDSHLDAALASSVAIIFILRADGLELAPVVQRIHDAGKLATIHIDLVDGVRADRSGIAWLARAGVDAVISSHGQLMRAIQRERMVAIHRLLLVRRGLLESAFAAVTRSGADIVELIPGVILPEVRDLLPKLEVPLLAGGFIRTVEEAGDVIRAGAAGVTTSSENLWQGPLG